LHGDVQICIGRDEKLLRIIEKIFRIEGEKNPGDGKVGS
jgi:nitrogen regulatory protein PII